ncbi:RNA polymerase sigma factor SigZ [Microbulbifer sp. TRSA005]|uniref:RNA polymerase sigma factor SigZ n=1 Tax=unclassified Microbulbifer TaxID=2619833 RepID=UPI0040395A1E
MHKARAIKNMTIDSVWKEYRSALRAFLSSKVSSADAVDDLLQEILIKIHRNLHTVRDQKSIKSWLFQIANRTVIDFYRENGRLKEVELEDNLLLPEEDSETQRRLSACIEPFVNALPQESAALLKAIELEGQSQKSYATEHKIPYSTLKSRVQKGRSQLRKLFEDCCHFTHDSHGTVIDYVPKSKHHKNC